MADPRYPNLPDYFATFRTLSLYDPSFVPTDIVVSPSWGTLEEKQGTINYIVDYYWHMGYVELEHAFIDCLPYENEYDTLSLPEKPTREDIEKAGFIFLFSCKMCDWPLDFYGKNKGGNILCIFEDSENSYWKFNPENPPLIDKSFPQYYNNGKELITPENYMLELKDKVDAFIKSKKNTFTDEQYEKVATAFKIQKPDEVFSVLEPSKRDLDGTRYSLKTYYVADDNYFMQEFDCDYTDKMNPRNTFIHTYQVAR